ncbi:MAG: SMI1/KNR4 family protein [Planctomycetota bacterium]
MKIAPVTEGWNDGQRDWTFVKDPSRDIHAWEQQTGVQLPESYLKFMTQFNGGRVYPRLFYHTVPEEILPPVTRLTFVGGLYHWKTVMSHFRGETFGDGQPKGYLAIGDTPGGIEILMGLKGENHGKIFCWPHNNEDWGSEDNREVYLLASDFSTFLKMLFDEDDESDFKAWGTPLIQKLAKDFEPA